MMLMRNSLMRLRRSKLMRLRRMKVRTKRLKVKKRKMRFWMTTRHVKIFLWFNLNEMDSTLYPYGAL